MSAPQEELTALADRDFRDYLIAVMCGDVGTQIIFIAISWHVFVLTHQPFDLGLIGFAMFVPALLLAIPSGVIADRFDRRVIVTAGRGVDLLCAAALFVIVQTGLTSIVPILAVVVVLGCERSLGRPAEKSTLRNIVEADRYVNAQAMQAASREISTICGPAIGGALVALSVSAAFVVAAAMALIAAVAFLRLRIKREARAPEPQTLASSLAGLAFIRSRPVILGAITLDLFAVLFGGATALEPVYAATILHIGPVGLGWLRSAPALGAAVAPRSSRSGRRASTSGGWHSSASPASRWPRSCSGSRRTCGSRSRRWSCSAASTSWAASCATASFS